MLTVECKVQIDWIEDGSVDEIIQEMIVEEAVSKVSKSIQGQVDKMAVEILDQRVNAMIDDIWANFIEKRVNLTDKYGDVVESHNSIKDMLKARLDGFINQQVDSSGNPVPVGKCGYNTKRRIDYMIDVVAKNHTDIFMKGVQQDFDMKLKAMLDAKMKSAVSSSLLKNIDVGKLLDGAIAG